MKTNIIYIDKTPKYIKMCEEAKKIQYKHVYNEGDWFCWQGNVVCLGHYVPIGENIVTAGGYDYDFQDIDYTTCVWLPTQGQLQKIIFTDESTSVRQMIRPFYTFIQYYRLFCPSMEQLWLSYVMNEKYDKIWDDKKEKWI